ncbi:ABC transporter permease [Promethearchaeum syntrophicum]|uniref:ABC transporter permease n=1 Tax=Promethearchaeum syntrophicum TaxID=2594042 RepID=A0A5B9D9X2_9ARCH|nr:ABC transporter permease [Candidatus Prometheoarchaeum syntrophicum]QEE15902.1 macrolide transporter ATP-binding /permease protein [Candidatus Prometheoarchaeum syntrophicum]
MKFQRKKGNKGISVFNYALQDLSRDRVKTIFGIAGITISLFLLTMIGCLADSLAFSYLDQATIESGSSDIQFSKISSQTDLNFDPYFPENIIEERLKNIDEIDNFYPRIMYITAASFPDPTLDNLTVTKNLFTYGIKTTLEQNSGKMGNLWICKDNEEYERSEEIFQGPIQSGNVVLTRGAAKLFHIRMGDYITIQFASSKQQYYVQTIVDQDLRFPRTQSSIILFELPDAQHIFKQEGKVNYVHATLKNQELVYDTRDNTKTLQNLREIAEKIQIEVGFDYLVSLPKMDQMAQNDLQTMMMDMTFSFITFFSMLITGILINSILSASVEERIREFGVLRVLGAKKLFTFKMVLVSGFIMAVVGTVIGTLIAAFAGPPLLNLLFNDLEIIDTGYFTIKFIILPETILRSFLIGIIITTVISIIPARHAGKVIISNAIDPARRTSVEEYKLKKEGSANVKVILIGIALGIVGAFIFLVLPRLLSGGSGTNITNYVLVGLLLAVLMGLVFISIGLVPVFEAIISQLLRPFIKKYYSIYKINLYRYRRRNYGNIVMFALTFSFIFFISSVLAMDSANSAVYFQFQYGSDLIISNTGNFEAENVVDFKLLEDLEQIPGIKTTSGMMMNSFDITKIFSMIFRAGEEGIGAFDFDALFGTIPKLGTFAGDMGDYQNFMCSLLAIDENYYDVVDRNMLLWDSETESSDESIETMLNTENSCIISKVLADNLGVYELPAEIRLSTFDPAIESNPNDPNYNNIDQVMNISVLTVVGVSTGLPGMNSFKSSELSLFLGPGVLLNMEDYSKIMNWGAPNEPESGIDKILINLVDNSYENVVEMKSYLENYFEDDYSFIIDDAVSKITLIQDMNQTSSIVMEVILFFSVLVSLFGLLTSMYSTLLERMFEIGILRAMGLKPIDVRYMLMAESFTVMMSSGTLGAIVGWFIAYLLQINVSTLTEVPIVSAINVGTLLSTYLISIGISVIGMIIITRRVEKMSIIDVLRSTF